MTDTPRNTQALLSFDERLKSLKDNQELLLTQENNVAHYGNGIYQRWENPIITREHAPINWCFDLNPETNPHLMERIGINATLNSGAIYFNDKYLLVVRVEGNDRKSFFAVAESENGIDNFRFWSRPITLPETEVPDTNVYDMRLTAHEDGYIYGLFCTERKDMSQLENTSAAEAQCGIARTKDLINWERLPDLITYSGQQRNVVLHSEFVDGQYALFTRPQDGFISVGGGGGIGWGLTPSMENAEIKEECIVDSKIYHTINEVKNGQGPAPLKTAHGWLHLAHGVRNTAAGLRYVLYMFMTDLQQPWKIIHKPGGHFIAPEGIERVGDVSNVAFSNGWILNDNNDIFIYYASSDTRMHVATSTLDKLIDYCINTPEDDLRSAASVQSINRLIDSNIAFYTTLADKE
ncbi:MAG: glycosidase [Colwellia sp.]